MITLAKQIISATRRRVEEWLGKRRARRLTLEGALFIGITFFIGFAAMNTGTNLLYLILSMMLSLLIISGVLSTVTLRNIEVERIVPNHIAAQEQFPIQLVVRNRKRLFASYSLRVSDHLDMYEGIGSTFLVKVGKQDQVRTSYFCVFPRRGIYTLKYLQVSSRFPFGFFERSITFIRPREIVIYPQVLDMMHFLETSRVDFGEHDRARKGPGTSLYGLREYQAGDSARFIHWKISAKTDKLMIREFEREEKHKVTLFLNNSSALHADPNVQEQFEKAIVMVASMAHHLLYNEYQVQLITASGKIPFSTGINHLYRILRALAMIQLLPPQAKQLALSPPDADSENFFLHFDPSSTAAEQYALSANIIDTSKWKIHEGKLMPVQQ
jgi:uncharacterized protein (DUF58 family)